MFKIYKSINVVRFNFTVLLVLLSIGQTVTAAPPNKILFLLGSGNLETSVERVETGYRLYGFSNVFDNAIVGEYCAHSSSNTSQQ